MTKDWEWCKKHDAFSFSIIANNAEYYTGTMYTDAYTIAWGYIQRRGDDIAPGEAYTFVRNHMSTGGADPVLKKLGSFQRKLLGRVTSSTTFDCKSIPGWEDFTENNFAIIPVKIDATGGQWKNGATGAGGAQQGGCTPTLSYDKVNGILKVSNFSWNNDYAYGSYWTNYCHGNMTADVYCYHF